MVNIQCSKVCFQASKVNSTSRVAPIFNCRLVKMIMNEIEHVTHPFFGNNLNLDLVCREFYHPPHNYVNLNFQELID